MAPSIVIRFDNVVGVFFPGQTITGTVYVTNDKKRKCEGISLKFEGNSRVQFEEMSQKRTDKGTENKTTTYIATEKYYKSKFLVWSDYTQQLQPGQFQFPFTFVLPMNSPASFQCRYGAVEHFCQAKIKLHNSKDPFCKMPYSVNSLLDLNMDPANSVAQTRQGMKNLCCLCCRSGPITAHVCLDRLGYVPGEAIIINAEINNSSNRKVTETKAELFMTVQLLAVGRNRTEHYRLMSVSQPEIPKGGDCIWAGHGIIIPPLPASGLLGCSIINVNYNLKFTVSPKLPATSLTMDFPIIVGSIPLRETFQRFAPAPYLAAENKIAYESDRNKPGITANSYLANPSDPGSSIAYSAVPGPSTAVPKQIETEMEGPPPEYQPPVFPGLQQYPDMPPPTYSQVVTDDLKAGIQPSQDSNVTSYAVPGASNSQFTPTYISYTLRGNPALPTTQKR